MMAKATYSRVAQYAQYEAEVQGLQTENSRYARLFCSFSDANATYSMVAQCEAQIEALRTENNRYFYD